MLCSLYLEKLIAIAIVPPVRSQKKSSKYYLETRAVCSITPSLKPKTPVDNMEFLSPAYRERARLAMDYSANGLGGYIHTHTLDTWLIEIHNIYYLSKTRDEYIYYLGHCLKK